MEQPPLVSTEPNPDRAPDPNAAKLSEFKFIFSIHTIENAAAISQQFADCDVIALENILLPAEKYRSYTNELLTSLLSSTISFKDRAKTQARIFPDDREAPNLILEIIRPWEKSDKAVVFIDMAMDDPRYQLVEAWNHTDNALGEAEMYQLPNAETKRRTIMNLQAQAKAAQAREALVVEQLTAQGTTGKKIGVMIGATHTPTRHALARKFESSSVFVLNEAGASQANPTALYRYGDQAVREVGFYPDKALSDQLLDRVLLESIYLGHGYELANPSTNPNNLGYGTVRSRSIDHMSAATVAEVLGKIDEIRLTCSVEPAVDSRLGAIYQATENLLRSLPV